MVPLIAITLLGLILRFWQLGDQPISLNWDEVSHGYNAFSILKTGADEWGFKFPLIFRAFGDYKLPLYIYLTVPSVAIFGLNAFAVRFVSALAGTLAIPGIYLLTRTLLRGQTPNPSPPATLGDRPLTPLVAALFLALSPWHFFISRPALEANLSLTLIIFGFWALLKALKKPRYWLLGSILLSLSLHTYLAARVFVPLMLLAFFWLKRRDLVRSLPIGISAAVFLVSLALVGYQVITGVGTARYAKLNILNEAVVHQIGQRRTQSSLPLVLARFYHNRPVYFANQVAKNYLNYFSPQFFYQSQGAQEQFAIPNKNLFTLPVLLLAIIGLFFGYRHRFLLIWLLLSPVAASLTASPPQSLRPNPMIPPVIIFAAIGFIALTHLIPSRRWTKPVLSLGLLFIIAFGFFRYWQDYWGDYRTRFAGSWQYGYRQVIKYLNQYPDEYDKIIFTKRYGEPHIFHAFYSKLDPRLLQPDGDNIRFFQSDWYWTDRIGQVYFVNDWDIPHFVPAKTIPLESGGEVSVEKSLLVASPDHLPSNTSPLKLIEYPDGNNAFIITRF